MHVDLHVHTCFSNDSLTSLDAVVRWMARRRVDVVAITDHNAIAGALALHARMPQGVIVGEEILSAQGDISGLFLEEAIPSGLSVLETATRIHAQGGLVYLPHPCDRLRGLKLAEADLCRLLEQADIVEVLNARSAWMADNRRAEARAREAGLLCGAGSDAHMGLEIGHAYVDVPPFAGPAGLLAALAEGRVGGRMSGAWVHLGSRAAYAVKRLRAARIQAANGAAGRTDAP